MAYNSYSPLIRPSGPPSPSGEGFCERNCLLTDAKNLPKRFKGLAAAQRRLAKLSASGAVDAETYAVMENAAADVFWPQARTAAVKDAAIRKACLPYIQQLRPLYACGTEVKTRRDWRVFQKLMQTFGPKFTLWAASRR